MTGHEDTTPPDVRASELRAEDSGAADAGAAADAAGSPEAVERARALLAEERSSIDNIDAALVNLLAERFRHTQRVGRLKAEHGLPPADPRREEQQVARLRALAQESGLDPVFAESFLKFIVTEVIRHHEQIRGEDAS
ncbi:chorismate mutase [Brachybacterium sp. ACRRE]|uniref:chorismate mutase n=1 Tax=Brachybacterium sp. ACRRE TaxID=2918184 RepID=UPI0021075271|nr:chorismate mutase [Brachybacterium sp. ACRRE]